MPSNKPRLMTYTTEDIIKKFAYISAYEKRSSSKELEFVVEEYINNFEKLHGELAIGEDGTIHLENKRLGKSSTLKSG